MAERRDVAIGPVQLIVLGFQDPDFHGEFGNELERLRGLGTVRVIDALALHKDADGEIEVVHLSNLSKDEAIELGSVIGALVGLEIEGEEGIFAGADDLADRAGTLAPAEAWDVLKHIPADSSAALVLIEHHWAVGLRHAIARMGGFRIKDGFVSPLDLIDVGLVSHEEAYEPAPTFAARRVVGHASRCVARRR